MRAADLLRWVAVLGLGAAALYIYHPIPIQDLQQQRELCRPWCGQCATSEIKLRGYEAFALAESIVAHKGFSDPFMPLPTGPSAHLAPLYPAYLALILKVFGHGAIRSVLDSASFIKSWKRRTSVPWVLHCFTLLSLPGLFSMWKKARLSAYVTGLWLVLFPMIYYFVQFLERYRYPILWATFLPGSYFLMELAQGILGKQETQGERAPITVSNSEAG